MIVIVANRRLRIDRIMLVIETQNRIIAGAAPHANISHVARVGPVRITISAPIDQKHSDPPKWMTAKTEKATEGRIKIRTQRENWESVLSIG